MDLHDPKRFERRGKYPDWAWLREYWKARRARVESDLEQTVSRIGSMVRIKR